jgi:hypothetical protein
MQRRPKPYLEQLRCADPIEVVALLLSARALCAGYAPSGTRRNDNMRGWKKGQVRLFICSGILLNEGHGEEDISALYRLKGQQD